MNRVVILVALAAAPCLALAQQEHATHQQRDQACDAFVYSEQFLHRFPKAPAACLDVVTQNGEKWVHFEGKVNEVKGSQVTTTFFDDFNNPVSKMTFDATKAMDQRITVNGKEVQWTDLQPGDKLSIWVPQSIVGFYSKPGSLDKGELKLVKASTTT